MVDNTIEEAENAITNAAKLSLLVNQQVYDLEKQYVAQENRLREVQIMLQLKEKDNKKMKKMVEELKKKYDEEEDRRQKEFEEEQWTFITPSESNKTKENDEFELEQSSSDWSK